MVRLGGIEGLLKGVANPLLIGPGAHRGRRGWFLPAPGGLVADVEVGGIDGLARLEREEEGVEDPAREERAFHVPGGLAGANHRLDPIEKPSKVHSRSALLGPEEGGLDGLVRLRTAPGGGPFGGGSIELQKLGLGAVMIGNGK